MALTTETATPNSMIIPASATTQKSIAAQTGNHVITVQIVRLALKGLKVRLAREVLKDRRVFPVSEAR